jgi:hypothetical protein
MQVEYPDGASAFTAATFVALAKRVWPRHYVLARSAVGIGREFVRRALDVAPGGKQFVGAQAGNEEFFDS